MHRRLDLCTSTASWFIKRANIRQLIYIKMGDLYGPDYDFQSESRGFHRGRGNHSPMSTLRAKAIKLGATEFGHSHVRGKRFYVIYRGHRINFGAANGSTYVDHEDQHKRAAWYARHSNIKLRDGRFAYRVRESPSYWSWHLLWSWYAPYDHALRNSLCVWMWPIHMQTSWDRTPVEWPSSAVAQANPWTKK